MVETPLLRAPEHELVVFEHLVSLFIDIDLKSCIEWVRRELVMVGECHDVITESTVCVICFLRRELTLVEDAFYACMSVEIGSFPT